MNLNRAIHITRHNLCVEVRLEKAVPKPKGTTNRWLEYWKIILEALEKQKPKKPIHVVDDGIRYTDSYRCPTCERGFTGTGIADYCYHCGQRIDWEE